MTERECAGCGRLFFAYTYEIRRGHGEYCSRPCRNYAVQTGRRLSGRLRQKISKALKGRVSNPGMFDSPESRERHSKLVGAAVKTGRRKPFEEMSSRTKRKVLARLKLNVCAICGWDESSCDIHHMRPKGHPDRKNLKYQVILCPNDHRKWHDGKGKESDVNGKTLAEVLPDDLLFQAYYG